MRDLSSCAAVRVRSCDLVEFLAVVTNVLLDMLPIFCVARKEELYFGNQALFEPLESHCVHISWASLGKDAPQNLVNIQLAGTRIYERLRHTNTFVARKILPVHLLG